MKMILHILRKDLRRHWREVALYTLVCLAWTMQKAHPYGWRWFRQQDIAPVVMFALWFFIVVRVVQGECLVGDREFWMTRPYRWQRLMIEKTAFLALCLNGPLLIAQIYLLHHAQIPLSMSLVPRLLFLQFLFVFFCTFPAAVLASLTQSLVQWLLAIAGLLVAAFVISWLPWDNLPNTLAGQEDVASWTGVAVMAPALAFALLWMYARRRAWPARLAAGAACLVIPLTILLAHAPWIWSIAYPQAPSETPLRVSIANQGAGRREYTVLHSGGPDPSIAIPVVLGSADPDMTIAIDGMRVTLIGDNGWRWQSQWINSSTRMSDESTTSALTFAMPDALAERLESVHAKATVEYAFSTYHLGPVQRIDTVPARFTIEGAGFCSWNNREFREFKFFGEQCVAPLRMPAVMVSVMESGHDTCKNEEGEPPIPSGYHSTSVDYGTESMPADFNPDPLRTFGLAFGGWNPPIRSMKNPKEFRTARLCQGSPLTVRTGVLADRMRATFDLGPIGTENKSKPEEDPKERTVQFDPRFE